MFKYFLSITVKAMTRPASKLLNFDLMDCVVCVNTCMHRHGCVPVQIGACASTDP